MPSTVKDHLCIADTLHCDLGIFQGILSKMYAHKVLWLAHRIICSRTTGWGQLKMVVQKWGSLSPKDRQKGKTDAWPAYFDLTRVFSWEEEAASCTSPSCGQEVHQQPGPHSQAEQNRNVRAWKVLQKNLNPPTRMKLRSRGGGSRLSVGRRKSIQLSPSSRILFLLKQWFSTIAVCENHLGSFFFK